MGVLVTVQTDTVASFNELAAYFRQRQATRDGDRWYGGSVSSYENGIDQWIAWPGWLNPRCEDRYSALDAGRCCRDSASVAVRRALNLSDVAREVLAAFDRGDRGCGDAGATLCALTDAVPQVVASVRVALAGADRALAVQLSCALDRVSLFTGRLADRRGCPWRCAEHGNPDLDADLAPLREQIDECSGAIWEALHPRVRAVRT
jgi:hypothetical protein